VWSWGQFQFEKSWRQLEKDERLEKPPLRFYLLLKLAH
jgi:hypothetical protein